MKRERLKGQPGASTARLDGRRCIVCGELAMPGMSRCVTHQIEKGEGMALEKIMRTEPVKTRKRTPGWDGLK